MNFADLLAQLPQATALPDIVDGGPGVIQHVTDEPSPFIEPTLSVPTEAGQGDAPIALLSASAAVGKSYLARYLSSVTGNPLWDLSKANIQVGSLFFSGNLVESYGPQGFAAFMTALQGGQVAIIVDALDEALVKAGFANYEQAIENLARVVGSSGTQQVRAVLLGRPESLDFAGVKLLECGVTWRRMALDYFTEEQGRRFIQVVAAANADARSRSGRSNQNPADVAEFTNLVFELVSDAIARDVQGINDESATSNNELRSFLGYAPVLSALAVLADEGNAHARLKELQSSEREMAVWELLSHVMRGILDREKTKISSSSPRTELVPLLEVAFSAERQISHLVNGFDPNDLGMSADIPEADRNEVCTLVESQLRDHPFMDSRTIASRENPALRFANVALRDYVAAQVLLRGNNRESKSLMDFWSHDRVLPSPLLVRLLLADDRKLVLSSHSLGAVLDSAGTRLGGRELETVLEVGRDGPVEFTVRENGQKLGSLAFAVERKTLSLSRSLSTAAVLAAGYSVELGTGRTDFTLGPGVFISCEHLFVGSETVQIASGEVIRIEASSVAGTVRRLVVPDENLQVEARILSYPWDRYSVGFQRSAHPLEEIYVAGMGLRRLCKWFVRTSMVDAFTYPVTAMHTIVGKGRAPGEWLEFLKERGYIERRGYAYGLHLPCELTSVINMNLSDSALIGLIEDYLNAR